MPAAACAWSPARSRAASRPPRCSARPTRRASRASIEMDWGDWEGETLAALRERLGERDARERSARPRFPARQRREPPRSRTRESKAGCSEIARDGMPTLAVTHRGVIRAILAEATGWDMRGKPPARLDWDAVHLFVLDGAGQAERRAAERASEGLLPRSAPARHRPPEARGDARARAARARASRSRWRAAAAPVGGIERACNCPPASERPELQAAARRARQAGRRGVEAQRAATRCSPPCGRCCPDVLVIELFPFGRRQMRFELLPLLEAAAATPRRPASSARCAIPAPAEPGARGGDAGAASSAISTACWCTATRASRASSAASAAGAHRRQAALHRLCGRGNSQAGDAGKDEVLVSAGGGAVGAAPARGRDPGPAADALARPHLAHPGRASTCRAWKPAGGVPASGVDRRARRNDFTLRLAKLRAVGEPGRVQHRDGDAAGAGARAVLVPFAGGDEIRADAARAAAGRKGAACEVVEEAVLTPATLAAAIDRAARAAAAGAGGDRPRTARGAALTLLREWAA